jgi:hypothetical protein
VGHAPLQITGAPKTLIRRTEFLELFDTTGPNASIIHGQRDCHQLGKRTKSSLEGEEVVIRVRGGWFIVKRPAQGAMIGPGTPAVAEAPAEEILDAL